MRINFNIPQCLDFQVDQAVTCYLIEHVLEER